MIEKEVSHDQYVANRAGLYEKTLGDYFRLQEVKRKTNPLRNPTIEWHDSFGDVQYTEITESFMTGQALIATSLRNDLHEIGERGFEIAKEIELEIGKEYKL